MSVWLATNVYRLGEGREIELRQPTLAPMLNKDIKFSLCSSALLLPSRCCLLAFVSLVVRRRNKSFNVGLRIWNSDSRCFIINGIAHKDLSFKHKVKAKSKGVLINSSHRIINTSQKNMASFG